MEKIPQLVQDFNLRNTTNAVCVAVVKFTIDQFDVYFTASAPAPAKLGRQIESLRAAYDVMNDAYAEQQKRFETAGIKRLDDEGDQLLYGVKGILEGAIRMTFDEARLRLSEMLWETFRKYHIDPTENMISEWSKVQQFCEEYLGSTSLQEAGTALSLDSPIRRLATIAGELRALMTERNAAAPTQGAMASAREAIYPEYRTAILLLNAFVATNDDPNWMKALVKALNDNIDYVRRHAMTQGSGGGSTPKPDDDGGGDQGGGSDDGGGDEPTPTPAPDPEPSGGDTPGGSGSGGGSDEGTGGLDKD